MQRFWNDRKKNEKKLFKLTKLHTIDYYNHSYYINKVSPKDLLNGKIKKELWNKEYIRCTLFKWYFDNFKNVTEENCKLFFKEKLNKIRSVYAKASTSPKSLDI